MAAPRDIDNTEDLSALAWVSEELRRALEAAHKSLRRYLKESASVSDADSEAVDPAVLRQARTQIHQGAGALELVGLPTAARMLRAAEAAITRIGSKPKLMTPAAVEIIEHASFALLDYLQRLLAGKRMSPLAMFPQYKALQELAGAQRVHPADLWAHDWEWRAIADVPGTPALAADAATISRIEAEMLTLMRGLDGQSPARMSLVFAALANGVGVQAGDARLATLWRLAGGFYESLSRGLLRTDVYGKRLGSRLLAQLRAGAGADPSDRLAEDLLFFCSQAATDIDHPPGPRLAAVRQAYGLVDLVPVNYEQPSLGRFDPALLVQARKRLNGAKDVWSAVAGGELARLPNLNEQFALVGESLTRLYPQGDTLAHALQSAATHTVASGSAPAAELAMEVATGLLYLDASFEDGDLDHAEMPARVRRLAQRIDQVRQGQAAEPLEAWMEDLYRRVSDRQTMGSVVQELRASLSEAEKQIDQYFRDPAQREVLIPVPAQLQSMRGVFSVLGLDHASHAVLRMRDDVDALAQTEVDPHQAIQAGTFDRLADNLGALSFLIDMLSVQPAMAKSLFRFDAEAGLLRAVMGLAHRGAAFGSLEQAPPAPPVPPELLARAQALAAAAAEPDTDAMALSTELAALAIEAKASDHVPLLDLTERAVRSLEQAAQAASFGDEQATQTARAEVAAGLNDFVNSQVADLAPEPAAPPPSRPMPLAATPSAPPQATGLEEDDEMREIFLEEAREVIDNARQSLADLQADAGDNGAMTSVRRAFHTLKGSSRMVGLTEFGEAGWACEQLYNARLAEAPAADAPLLAFTGEALDQFARWVDAISQRADGDWRHGVISEPANALRTGRAEPAAPRESLEPAEPVAAPAEIAPTEPAPLEIELPDLPATEVEALPPLSLHVPELSSADDLAFAAPEAAPPSAIEPPAVLDLDFSLDLGALDAPREAPAEPTPAVPAPAFAGPDSDVDLALDLVEEAPAEPALPLELPAEPIEALEAPEALELPEVPEVLEPQALAEPEPEPQPEPPPEPEPEPIEDESVKVIGPLRIGIPLFNIYLNEADELSRRLVTELAEWQHELQRPAGETPVALAHSLAGSSATVGYTDLSQLARSLEHALMRSNEFGRGTADEAQLFSDAADDIRRLLHQFAAGFLKPADESVTQRLAAHEAMHAERMVARAAQPTTFDSGAAPADFAASRLDGLPSPGTQFADFGQVELKAFSDLPEATARPVVVREDALDDADDIDAVDAIDAELFPIFEEEGLELMPQLQQRMREWVRRPSEAAAASACMRTLHTLKGGARLAGAMRLGEMAHRLETAIEHLMARGHVAANDVEALLGRADAIENAFEAVRRGEPTSSQPMPLDELPAAPVAAPVAEVPPPVAEQPAEPAPASALQPFDDSLPVQPLAEPQALPESANDAQASETAAAAAAEPARAIDWGRFLQAGAAVQPLAVPEARATASQAAVRVRAPLLDRLVSHAGEVSITRARIESDVNQLKGSLGDLTDNLERLRRQLRDIELQAETQISTRMEAAKAASQEFDPLEMDRFTRFQELTRMMAESVNDVATVQRGLQRTLQSAEDELAAQARLTRDLQDDLLRTRMVEFEGLSERLYRVVRQAAKETGKQVRLDIAGGSIEIDRGVLDRMTGAFEHLLRNCVAHGIELPDARSAAGKDASGQITIVVTQEGNEVGVEFRDDGAGLDLAAIRAKAQATGLVAPDAQLSEADIANLIFMPGFTTASTVTELAGRGIGMDVVKTEVNAMGGRIETATAPGRGTSFRLVLPLTTAVTQVVMLRCGDNTVAVPSPLVEIVRRAAPADVEAAYQSGGLVVDGRNLPFFWLGALLQGSPRGPIAPTARTVPVVIIRSAAQRIALHVDEVAGNQEVVVKNLGPQLARLPGLAGMTLLPSGAPALIYNPVALATLYGDAAWALMRQQPVAEAARAAEPEAPQAPLVLVVDDSLTVRRVTQRLLLREGYRVSLAKDGLEGLEKLAEERPAVLLSDIEMPRMDGFDLVRNLRADPKLADLPVIMITSRIAQKHRDYAAELGVDHYLGKPYSEEDLMALVARYARAAAVV